MHTIAKCVHQERFSNLSCCPPTLLLLLFSLNLLSSCLGCAPNTQGKPLQIVAADSIVDGDRSWKLENWSEAADQKIAAYFIRNQSLAENPSFSGQKFLYEDSKGGSRYYWANAVGEQCLWIMLEFKGTRASDPIEGSGQPFSLEPTSTNKE